MKNKVPRVGKSMKKSLQRLLSMMIVVCMCLSMVPPKAEAWKILSHVNSADLILMEMERSKQQTGTAKVTIYAPYGSSNAYTYTVPQEFQDAILSYPDSFRAGSMGPDIYPDLMTGQGYIHPFTKIEDGNGHVINTVGSGEWITALCDSVNKLPKNSAERKEALAFTLGFMLHYCGDMFGHDFINSFAGGTYPLLEDVNYANTRDPLLNIILSHSSEETEMDGLVNFSFLKKNGYLGIKAPTRFVTETLVYNGNVNNGAAWIYGEYGELPALYTYLVGVRDKLYKAAEDMRSKCELIQSTTVKALDAWIEDLDVAAAELVKTFDTIGRRMINEPKTKTLTLVREEIMKWFDSYGTYISPAPDILIDGIKLFNLKSVMEEILAAIGADVLIQNINDWIDKQIEKIALQALGLVGLEDDYNDLKERLKDPSKQLNHSENPFHASANDYAEYYRYMLKYAEEQNGLGNLDKSDILNGRDGGALDRAINSEFEAFYNTMVMFKLILIGPDNFTDIVKKLSGVTQEEYTKNTANVNATSIDVTIKTANTSTAGTDSNIYVVVYRNGVSVSRKLLDKSSHNDFEKGVTDTYTVGLGEPVRLDELDVKIKQETTYTAASEWDCESIKITPYHAGIKLLDPIDLGGCYNIKDDDTWELHYHDELMMRLGRSNWGSWDATRAELKIKTDTNSGAGTDANIYADVYYYNNPCREEFKLDLPDYDDFENGKEATYSVPLSNLTYRGVALSGLNIMLRHKGSSLDAWTPKSCVVTLYHGDIQLTNPMTFEFGKDLCNSSWNLDLNNSKNTVNISKSLRSIPGLSLDFDYETNLDDGLAKNILSLDDSLQWKKGTGFLWSNETVRRNLFFQLFKGFGPDCKIDSGKTIIQGDKFDLDLTFEGVWNGVRKSRRDLVVAEEDAMPNVNGTAKITFLKEGREICSTSAQTVSNNKLSLKQYTNENLLPGTYDIRVDFSPNTSNQQYSSSSKLIEEALRVNAKPIFTVTFRVTGGTWNDGTADDKVVTLRGTEAVRYLEASQIPAAGDHPGEGYKAGGWNTTVNAETPIIGDVTFTYNYAPKSTKSTYVIFKVRNGSWNNGSTTSIRRFVTVYEDEVLRVEENQFPAVGNRPFDGYKAGSWSPAQDTELTADGFISYFNPFEFIYTYEPKERISPTVTFKVANGTWDDGSTEDKTVNFSGYEGDVFKLSANNIPGVGDPGEGFMAGTWDIEPTENTQITDSITFTYTFAADNSINRKVTFKVVNGSWNDGSAEDKTVTLSGIEGDTLKLLADHIPAVGTKPVDNTYKAGSWDVKPNTKTEITGDTIYTYTYAKKKEIKQEVVFKVVNGSWDDGKTEDITVSLNGLEGDALKLNENDIPAVGNMPGDTYKAGSWDAEPDTETMVTKKTTYTYTYASREPISAEVTFKVVNGSWDNGKTKNVTVKLSGLEGDALKLTASQIPAVGTKPGDAYKAGSWNVTPDADTEITQNTTYTYTYASREAISAKVTFKVVNGSWNDGTSEDAYAELSGLEGDKLTLDPYQIPAVGEKPGDIYKAGSWDVTPDADTEITQDTTYTYTFAKKDEIKQTVTFKVVNGSWDDGETDEKTVILKGYEGDTLKLTADDIPAVGTKPVDNTYKAGFWNVTPDTETEITEATTYTYSYVELDKIIVTFDVDGGTQIEPVTIYSGETITAPEAPEKKDFFFKGWYSDEACTIPFDFTVGITEDTEIYAGWDAVVYTATGDTEHTNGSDSDAVITVKRNYEDDTCFAHFTGVKIDGVQLTEGTDYTAVPGSTVITLKASVLNSLSEGDHIVTAEFDDGKVDVVFSAKAANNNNNNNSGTDNNPKTGENDFAGRIAMLLLVGAAAGLAVSRKRTSRR